MIQFYPWLWSEAPQWWCLKHQLVVADKQSGVFAKVNSQYGQNPGGKSEKTPKQTTEEVTQTKDLGIESWRSMQKTDSVYSEQLQVETSRVWGQKWKQNAH